VTRLEEKEERTSSVSQVREFSLPILIDTGFGVHTSTCPVAREFFLSGLSG